MGLKTQAFFFFIFRREKIHLLLWKEITNFRRYLLC
nr:MAG TPA: hypothetical protein [Caudoviricetes sp.]